MVEQGHTRLREPLKKSGWRDERIIILTKDDLAVGIPKRGVLVTLTFWSGNSRLVFSEASRVLLSDEFQDIPVFFMDGDEYNDAFLSGAIQDSLRDHISHGQGECFWLSHGVLISRLDIHSADREEKIVAFTRLLRDQYP